MSSNLKEALYEFIENEKFNYDVNQFVGMALSSLEPYSKGYYKVLDDLKEFLDKYEVKE